MAGLTVKKCTIRYVRVVLLFDSETCLDGPWGVVLGRNCGGDGIDAAKTQRAKPSRISPLISLALFFFFCRVLIGPEQLPLDVGHDHFRKIHSRRALVNCCPHVGCSGLLCIVNAWRHRSDSADDPLKAAIESRDPYSELLQINRNRVIGFIGCVA